MVSGLGMVNDAGAVLARVLGAIPDDAGAIPGDAFPSSVNGWGIGGTPWI